MEQKKFKFINRIFSVMVLLTAAVTYLLTIEPTVSFWDCGEFIASSYKLEVGHAPGNPVFQLIARVFTMFASPEHAAMAVNVMSALCSAFTIFFLYLTIVHLGRRIIEKNGRAGELSMGEALSLIGAGIVGSLAYCWSDTFWFSAVEAEVYAMSSLFTAAVFWMILKWEEQADTEYADRWIVAIAFLMGLSIGVHLMNLLVIPAIAFVYYYKKASKVTTWGCVGVLALSAVILAVVLWGIIPYLPKIAAVFDLLFVNVFHLPFNSGAAFFLIVLLVLCFLAVYLTYRKGSHVWNIISLCFTMIVIGYSAFAMVVIRSANNTPTNEGQPDNPFALVKYLGREQYGSAPLVYGQTFASVYDDYKVKDYYTKMDSVYYKAPGPAEVSYPAESKMFFPRMHSKDPSHIRFYESYTQGRGKVIPGTDRRMPTFADNMRFFFDYQLNYMYMRYFMWNFAGRQNDLHGQVPGDPVKGNWECGIGFIDRARLGDQSEGPDYIVNNKGKNHYYMLPLQLAKDKRNWWITFLLFFLTGIAIILYLNQPPYQVRERDYAYAGSFYMFSIWIGLAVLAVSSPAWGRAQESYGEDQFLLGEMGAALTRAVQRYGVIACPKHYAMNSIENLRFKVNVTADDATLYDVYLPHFKACVDAGAGSIMGAYNLVFGEHACESRRLLTDILREEWGFEGFAISDFFYGIKDAARSLNAGLDMEMPTSVVRRFGVTAALRKGAVSQATVDECCTRIVATLLRFARLYDKRKFDRDVICCAEHTALARRAAEEGTVLLKNDGVLPVRDTNARIALVGRWADKVNVGGLLGDKGFQHLLHFVSLIVEA